MILITAQAYVLLLLAYVAGVLWLALSAKVVERLQRVQKESENALKDPETSLEASNPEPWEDPRNGSFKGEVDMDIDIDMAP